MVHYEALNIPSEGRSVDTRLQSRADGSSMQELPADFFPGNWDVICQRGKECFDHVGNQNFRFCIENHIEEYKHVTGRLEKSFIVSKIVDTIRNNAAPTGGSGFVRKDLLSKRWYSVGNKVAREKVGQALRDAIKTTRVPGRPTRKVLSLNTEISGWENKSVKDADKPVPLNDLLPYNMMQVAQFPVHSKSGNLSTADKRIISTLQPQAADSLQAGGISLEKGQTTTASPCVSGTSCRNREYLIEQTSAQHKIDLQVATNLPVDIMSLGNGQKKSMEYFSGASPSHLEHPSRHTVRKRGIHQVEAQEFPEEGLIAPTQTLSALPGESAYLTQNPPKKPRNSFDLNGADMRYPLSAQQVDILLGICPMSSLSEKKCSSNVTNTRRLSGFNNGGEMFWPRPFHPVVSERDTECNEYCL